VVGNKLKGLNMIDETHDVWAPGERELGKWMFIFVLAIIVVAVIGTNFFGR
jgi:hypothetical protein